MYVTRKGRSRFYDKLHRGFVFCCLGFTIVGTVYIGSHFMRYFIFERPGKIKTGKEMLLTEGQTAGSFDEDLDNVKV